MTWLLHCADDAAAFYVDLCKLQLEDAQCITSMEKVDTPPSCRRPPTLLFQFSPLILIVIILLVHNNL